MGDWFRTNAFALMLMRDSFVIVGMTLLVIASICFTLYSVISTIIGFFT